MYLFWGEILQSFFLVLQDLNTQYFCLKCIQVFIVMLKHFFFPVETCWFLKLHS